VEIVDGQLHEPGVWLEWKGAPPATWHDVLTESLLTTTDAVGVHGAVLMPSDVVWAESVAAAYPGRFTVIPRLNPGFDDPERREMEPEDPDIEEQISAAFARPGVTGIRFSIGFWEEIVERWHAGRFDRALGACAEQGVPIFLFVSGHLELVEPVAQRYPDVPIVVDHMGLRQPPLEPVDSPPWARLDELLALAKYENISVKLCGATSLSLEDYPFRDSWPHVERMLEAFGAGRLFWASDISRFRGRLGHHTFAVAEADYVGKHTYAESLAFYRDSDLSEDEKELILGGTIRRILNWPAVP
jgi:predicted TIM-barrel fold metal-dependent hydrolase